jgi:hypothetical protein
MMVEYFRLTDGPFEAGGGNRGWTFAESHLALSRNSPPELRSTQVDVLPLRQVAFGENDPPLKSFAFLK